MAGSVRTKRTEDKQRDWAAAPLIRRLAVSATGVTHPLRVTVLRVAMHTTLAAAPAGIRGPSVSVR
jgi:hypothetical protein